MGIEIKKIDENCVQIQYTRPTGDGEKIVTFSIPTDEKGAFSTDLRTLLSLGQSGLGTAILTYMYGTESNPMIVRAMKETFPDQILPDGSDEEIINPVIQTLFMYALNGETLTL